MPSTAVDCDQQWLHCESVSCVLRLSDCFNAVLMFCRSDFLPRGSGIVTRRPLVLQLINAKQGLLLSVMFYIVPPVFSTITMLCLV